MSSGGPPLSEEDQKMNAMMASIKETSSKFDQYRFPQKSVNLLDYSRAVSYAQSGDWCHNLVDASAYSHAYAEQLSEIGRLEELLREADYYISTLYTYRSYSKPLPMIPAELDDKEKPKLYKTVFDIITPHINKIKGLIEFHDRLVKAFVKNLRLLIVPLEKREPLDVDLVRTLIRVVDKFFVLNLLKDMKGQTKNDFARYKRAFQFIRNILSNSGELMAQITEVHNFLNDPSHPNNVVLHQLKMDVGAVPHREQLFAVLVNQCMEDVRAHAYVTSDEKHVLYRCILASLYLADDAGSGINVFKSGSKYFKHISKIREMVRRLPVLPVFMDVHTTVPIALLMCDNFTKEMATGNAWSARKHTTTYDLKVWRTTIQEHYISFSTSFVIFLHDVRAHRKNPAGIDVAIAARGLELVVRGLKLLGDWTAKLREQIAFKCANPASESDYVTQGGRGGKYAVYEQITRFNYRSDLKFAMVEIIGLIKGLSNLMLSAESKIRPILCAYVHSLVQQFVHKSLAAPLQRAHKKKGKFDELEKLMVAARLFVADNANAQSLLVDYKVKKEKELSKTLSASLQHVQSRAVFPTRTQCLLLRRILHYLVSPDVSWQQSGLLGSNFFPKAEVREFSELYEVLGRLRYVADLSGTIAASADLSSLWYREFYLNMTDCIQFPIAMSLPWMLTDYAMQTPSLAPNVFFPLSIYNDCAERALGTFRQQHLYDEIEAEVNLVFDQLMFTLYRKIFDYYKNKASKILLDKTFQSKLRRGLGSRLGQQMSLPLARYTCIFKQKHVAILGRSIDVESLLTEQLNAFIRDNIEVLIQRYDAATITSAMEIAHLLRTLRLTVEMLQQELPGIDAFDDVLTEVNEDSTLGSFRGRLFLTTYNGLFSSLLRNYIFNQLTRRFVCLERPRGNKKIDSLYLWGSRFTQVFQQRFKVTRGFFGCEHVEAVVELMGVDSMPLLVDETVKTVAHIIIRDISPYVDEILKNLDPMKLQNAYYGVLGVYGYYDMMLKYIKSYPALREGCFTLLREAGNALALVQMLDVVLSKESYYNHQIQAFYRCCEPAVMPSHCLEQMRFNNNKDIAVQDILYSSAAKEMHQIDANNTPFTGILKETLSQMAQTNKAWTQEKTLLKSCIVAAMKRERFLTNNSGGWLFSATLEYLYKNLAETGILKKWKGPKPENGILEHENPKDFSRFWSVATFIFLVPDGDPEEEAKKRSEGWVDDRSFFGDGWLWAGTTILYLTGLIHRYRLLDPTLYLDKLQRLYPEDLEPKKVKKRNKKQKGGDDPKEAYKPYVKQLLQGWQQMERDQDLIMSILKAHFVPEQEPITRFTPKWADQKKK
eukprot:CAMPEP_0202730760 /NCGR_PEP_ID=MMETSP1385-20130828/186801_1 /ASSEMBLY_ACC=CAM_ASM_000861 /TAXON_ID=933848 /ORGANISM="Elphidium margaritaceum" /LENGTH=1334 /DNA_ID=CAMNT_0049397039 /DNA_START=27 /DNA_END=4031 /DNA_ORIENTATION=+